MPRTAFFRQQRCCARLLIDGQAWFVLDDFARLIEHSQPEQMLARLDVTTRRAEIVAFRTLAKTRPQWLISESGAYAALIYQLDAAMALRIAPLARPRRGGAGMQRSADDSGMPRYIKLRWGAPRWCTCSTGRASSG
ncbi:BRO-N domain-containing protein [Pseudomonas aeruginosa]